VCTKGLGIQKLCSRYIGVQWLILMILCVTFPVGMEPYEVIQLVDAIGLLLEGCGQDHMTTDDNDEPLYQPHMLYELCDPLESREELHTCCLRKVSSIELATAVVKIM